MGKKPRRPKHVPQRMCIACRTTRPKRELVRVVRTPDGAVIVDETGKQNGRGAYLCRQQRCWDRALARDQLARALNVTLTAENMFDLEQYARGLPDDVTVDSDDSREKKGVG
ncbi:MAG TPA: YlxR family protein [Chloroflexi bacterium]|nr:YlxR family protein [Chloroflexota bacterium]